MQSHIHKVYARVAVTCHLHFWQNDQDLLRATAVTRGWNDAKIGVSTESWPWRRKFSRRSCRDSNPRPFSHESGALTTERSRPPMLPRAWVMLPCKEGWGRAHPQTYSCGCLQCYAKHIIMMWQGNNSCGCLQCYAKHIIMMWQGSNSCGCLQCYAKHIITMKWQHDATVKLCYSV